MKETEKDQAAAKGRLHYRAPEITDLGSVVELTEADAGGGSKYDGTGYGPAGHS